MDSITTIGLDIAKNVFQLHGVDESGAVILRRSLRRGQMLAFFGDLPPCLIGMEACPLAIRLQQRQTAFIVGKSDPRRSASSA